MTYADLRTGLTYRDVHAMLWSASDDPSTWRYRGRSAVLGMWREIKLGIWDAYQVTGDIRAARSAVLSRYSQRAAVAFLRRLRMRRQRVSKQAPFSEVGTSELTGDVTARGGDPRVWPRRAYVPSARGSRGRGGAMPRPLGD